MMWARPASGSPAFVPKAVKGSGTATRASDERAAHLPLWLYRYKWHRLRATLNNLFPHPTLNRPLNTDGILSLPLRVARAADSQGAEQQDRDKPTPWR